MRIAITGTPCVGKTSVAKVLAKELEYKLVDINELAKELDAYVGYDERLDSKILDMGELRKEIKKLKGDVIIEGHVSHEFSVDVVIVLRCSPSILEKRLKKKYPDKPEKVKENLESEILGVITFESVLINKKVYEVDVTDKTVEEVVKNILKIIHGKTKSYEVGKIDWLKRYEKKLLS